MLSLFCNKGILKSFKKGKKRKKSKLDIRFNSNLSKNAFTLK